MFEKFRPDIYLPDLCGLDFAALREKGIRGLILDIDNTIVPPGAGDTGGRAAQWIGRAASQGFRVFFLSNASHRRVKRFISGMEADAIPKAGKPSVSSFAAAAVKMGVRHSETAVIGDQLFTDIAGGRRAGMFTILVKPIDPGRDGIFIKFKRIFEKIVMLCWEK